MTAKGTIDSGSIFVPNGSPPGGIQAGYDPGDTATTPDPNVTGTVTVDNYANIAAAAGWGIEAFDFGNGNVTVNEFAGTVYGEEYGIAAYGSGGSGNVAINVSQDVTISTSSTTGLDSALPVGTNIGILAFSQDAGNISVTSAAGDAIASGSIGIAAVNDATTIPASANSTILVTAYGTIDFGSIFTPNGLPPAGIVAGYGSTTAEPYVTGTVTVDNYANITAVAGWGISAFNWGNGDVTVNDFAGTVYGEEYGIAAYSFGETGTVAVTGNVAVDVSPNLTISTSSTTGLDNALAVGTNIGILAFSLDAGNISVTTSAGDAITSGSDGIAAIDDATTISATANSTISVTAYGTIVSGTIPINIGLPPAGIAAGYDPNDLVADPYVTGTVTVNNYANIAAAAGWGIDAFNFGNGNVTVNDFSGTTVSGAEYGIAAYAEGGVGDITVSVSPNASILTSSAATAPDIFAFSNDSGNITVSTSTGDLISSGSSGICCQHRHDDFNYSGQHHYGDGQWDHRFWWQP